MEVQSRESIESFEETATEEKFDVLPQVQTIPLEITITGKAPNAIEAKEKEEEEENVLRRQEPQEEVVDKEQSPSPHDDTMANQEDQFNDESIVSRNENLVEKVTTRRLSILHDSMVTVRLSGSPVSTINTKITTKLRHLEMSEAYLKEEDELRFQAQDTPGTARDNDEGGTGSLKPRPSQSHKSASTESKRYSEDTVHSAEELVERGVLEKTKDSTQNDNSSDDHTALLLARLEQANNLLATNPKSGMTKAQPTDEANNSNKTSLPPLKNLKNSPTPPALRYSVIPPPPMTDLEFWGALVQDYTRTAQCLPTLLLKKVRSGIPAPLRGVVWQSMSGARDSMLEDHFDRLCGESSSYEGIIGKDLGRSFPGVEMFRDPEGDGQRMLGRVLKCFSLYDEKIGYCQGLGFLVGPLLMHMGDKQAFCVLVRLMEHYDLRSCFLPDLSGLHVRIYQFSQLLKQHLPTLSNHLDVLQIEPAYVSQWFLSFFAVTCPLPMLFRIYDAIFAEGASEIMMRVSLSLMQKNEEKIMACTEFEDVMQLLLSRGLWDVYHYNADEFVNDFVNLTDIVTHDSLLALEMRYHETQAVEVVSPTDNVVSAASRFLGRLWAASNVNTKSMSFGPSLSPPSQQTSLLRKSPSKQSIASTLDSAEGSGSDSMLSTSTDVTSISRDSSNADRSSVRVQSVGFTQTPKSNKDKDLHRQIEDLLTALSGLQREHAFLATQLQHEREEREEDRGVARSLLNALRKGTGSEFTAEGAEQVKASPPMIDENLCKIDAITRIRTSDNNSPDFDVSCLMSMAELRFAHPSPNLISSEQTKPQLREELARAKEQLSAEVSKSQNFSRQLADLGKEVRNLQEQVREGHAHVRNAHSERQRLERQVQDLRSKSKDATTAEADMSYINTRTSASSGKGGLRELRLGRGNLETSQPSNFGNRTSSLGMSVISPDTKEPGPGSPAIYTPRSPVPHSPRSMNSERNQDVDLDALVLELVQAKTAEAIAKQEAEETRSKFESLKKLLGQNSCGSSHQSLTGHKSSSSQLSGLSGYFGYGKSEEKEKPPVPVPVPATQPTPAATIVGGFWGRARW